MRTVATWQPRVEVMRAPTQQALLRRVGRAMSRGELGAVDLMRQTPTGWAVPVYRLRPTRRVWPICVVGTVATLACLAAIGWLLVGPLTALLGVLVPTVVGGLLIRWMLSATGDSGCTITHTRH